MGYVHHLYEQNKLSLYIVFIIMIFIDSIKTPIDLPPMFCLPLYSNVKKKLQVLRDGKVLRVTPNSSCFFQQMCIQTGYMKATSAGQYGQYTVAVSGALFMEVGVRMRYSS